MKNTINWLYVKLSVFGLIVIFLMAPYRTAVAGYDDTLFNVDSVLGAGLPLFTPLADIVDVRTPQGLAMADFNGDGRLDMATSGTAQNPDLVAIRFGNSDVNGTFQAPSYYGAGTLPGPISIGDFNGDGRLDLAVANSSTASRTRLAILINQGNGTFSNVTSADCQNNQPNCPGGADQIMNVAVGRVDGNNTLDLVVSDENSDLVRIFYGFGNGTFSSPSVVDFPNSAGGGSQFVALGDMDGDNDQDLIVALGFNAGKVQIKYNDGFGNFLPGQAPVDIAYSNPGPKSILIADFDGVRGPDIATANTINSANSANSISVKLRSASGGFDDAAGSPYFLGDFGPNSLATGDFNLDGRLDLASANSNSGSSDGFSVLLGNGNGSFGIPFTSSITGSNPFLVIAGDITGDNRLDLILANAASSGLGIGLRKNGMSLPTATVSGRVITPNGIALRNAIVSIINSQGVRMTATTSSFGNFSFASIETGQTYTFTVASKRYRYAARSVEVIGNLTLPDLVGLE